MSVHAIEATAAPVLSDVLMFDAIEREWRIGHARRMIPGIDEVYHCACSCAEAAALITDGELVPVFMSVSHWARLPEMPC